MCLSDGALLRVALGYSSKGAVDSRYIIPKSCKLRWNLQWIRATPKSHFYLGHAGSPFLKKCFSYIHVHSIYTVALWKLPTCCWHWLSRCFVSKTGIHVKTWIHFPILLMVHRTHLDFQQVRDGVSWRRLRLHRNRAGLSHSGEANSEIDLLIQSKRSWISEWCMNLFNSTRLKVG